MIEIQLTQGKVTIINEEDEFIINQFNGLHGEITREINGMQLEQCDPTFDYTEDDDEE